MPPLLTAAVAALLFSLVVYGCGSKQSLAVAKAETRPSAEAQAQPAQPAQPRALR